MRTKIIVALLVLLTSSAALAVREGVYLGLDVGQGKVDATSSSGALEPDNNTGFGVSAIVGYQGSRYAGAEFGFTHYPNVQNKANSLCDSSQTQTNSFDLLGKGIFPLWDSGFNVFAKGGLTVVRTSGDATVEGPGQCSSKNETLPRAKAALGASYEITQRMVANLTWSRAFINSSFVKNADLLALGITYHFADTYCGQFLC